MTDDHARKQSVLWLKAHSKAEFFYAGWTRFINHSCDPNCTAEKWQVGGELCIAITARQHISANEELTYDYRLEWNGSKRVRWAVQPALPSAVSLWNGLKSQNQRKAHRADSVVRSAAAHVSAHMQRRCQCGAATCRGWLGTTSQHSIAASDPDSDDMPAWVDPGLGCHVCPCNSESLWRVSRCLLWGRHGAASACVLAACSCVSSLLLRHLLHLSCVVIGS